MKRMLLVCLLCVGLGAIAMADNGTVANAPTALNSITSAQHQADLEYVKQQKALGTLRADDPVYLRVQNELRSSLPANPAHHLDQGNDNCPAVIIPAIPYTDNGNTSGMANDFVCSSNGSGDVVYQYTATAAGTLRAQTCGGITNYDTRLEVRSGVCPGADFLCNDDACGLLSILDFPVNIGDIVTIVVDGFSLNEGDYTLSLDVAPPIGRCCYTGGCADGLTVPDCQALGGVWDTGTCASNPCPPPPPPPGTLRVITVPVPSGIGVCISVDCRGDLYYTNYGEGVLHRMDAFGNLFSSTPIMDASGAQRFIDELGWDESRQLFWGGELNTNAIWTVDRTGLATFQFAGQPGIGLTDGCDYDGTDGSIWHSSDVSSSIAHFDVTGLLLGSLVPLDENGNPEGSISGVEVGANNTIWAGDSPIDDVRRVNKTTGAFVERFDGGQVRCEGMECDAINFAPLVAMWVKDAYNSTVTAFQIDSGTCVCGELPDTCVFNFEEVDHGDLTPCNYPTLLNNPAHGLSGVAWLGDCVTGEALPNILNLDGCDDGVVYNNLPWMPCTPVSVTVTVTGGPSYGRYEDCGGHLYLNGWKDGNLDGDFCDEISCSGTLVSEWLVHDLLVAPGAYNLTFIDPGVLDIGVYDGVFRWRLTSTPVGRNGFGLAATQCTDQCGTFGFDYLGEVEDYIINDAQLQVELNGFDAVAGDGEVSVNWSTAAETDNDHFELVRNGSVVAHVPASNNSSGSTYSWVDRNVENGSTYTYTLVAVDLNGAREELATESATPSSNAAVITEYSLHQNFPNPFNPETNITFDLVESGTVSLKVFNLVGQEVATLVNGEMSNGRHNINFTATGLPSGVYVYKLDVNGLSFEKKMVLMK